MPPTLITLKGAVHRDKMAAFDFDWTLVNPKDGKTFPSDVDDWTWLYPTVPGIIKQFYDDGYMIVIFTNQSKSWKQAQIELVATLLDIPMFVAIATDKADYKPSRVLFDSLLGTNSVDKEASFFVGDAIGGKANFSDSDKVFAETIGVRCRSPESIFRPADVIDVPVLALPKGPSLIIMMGFPGSGKSTVAKEICKDSQYVYIEGDVHKTKMIKAALEPMSSKKSVVFDATHSSIKKRKEYVDLAKKHDYNVLCIHVATSLEVSYKRNKAREADRQVPKIAYSVYSKYFEEPKEEEGFTLIVV